MRKVFYKLKMNITYKINSPSRLLHERFGEDLEIKIEGPARNIFGENFVQRKDDICLFYVTRLPDIPDSYGEVYLGRIGSNPCLVNVSEVVTAGMEVE